MRKRKSFGPEDQMDLFYTDQVEPTLSDGTFKEGAPLDAARHLNFGIPSFDDHLVHTTISRWRVSEAGCHDSGIADQTGFS